MLINSTTLTITRMAPSRTAVRGMWALVSAVQLVQRQADLNGAHPVFLSKSGCGKKFCGVADTEIKTWFLQLVHSLQGFEYAREFWLWSFGPNRPKGDLVP